MSIIVNLCQFVSICFNLSASFLSAHAQEDYLCEVALWTEWMHVGTAEAVEEVSLISIDAESFGDLVCKDRLTKRVVRCAVRPPKSTR